MAGNNKQIIEKKIADLIAAEYNPRRLTEEQRKHLTDSMKRFGCVDPVIVNTNADRENIVIGGHQRLKVWADLGNDTIPCVEVDLDRDRERELNIRLNQNTGEWDMDALGENFDLEELTDWGWEEDELAEIDFEEGTGGDDEQADDASEEVDDMESDHIPEEVLNSDVVFYAFSGGRDSQLALEKTVDVIREYTKIQVIYVNKYGELPDVLFHIKKIVDKHDLDLHIINPEKTFFDYYKKEYPDPVYMDCIDKILHKPMDEYVKNYEAGKKVVITGKTKWQSKGGGIAKKDYIQNKFKDTLLFFPLMLLDKEQYDTDIVNIDAWPGYELGFERTACWFCPFQTHKQYDALLEHYPRLWYICKDMAGLWKYKKIKGDGQRKRFYKYWGNE